MSAALLPITAILLLLSGISSPARGPGYPVRTITLGGHWHGGTLAGQMRITRSGAFHPASVHPASSLVSPQAGSVAAAGQPLSPTRAGQKLYITRFGFAEGAYLAQGPPRLAIPANLG